MSNKRNQQRSGKKAQRGNPRGKRQQQQYNEAYEILSNNSEAVIQGPAKKRWTKHDVKDVHPLTANQKEMFQCFFQGDQICAHGSAGTGKTFLATYLALTDILDPGANHKRIIFVRSAVPTRDLGHMPGSLEEKVALYEMPYRDILSELCGRKTTYDDMKKAGLIEFMPTSYIRGTTWHDAVVVVDEMQNMTEHEIDSIMTRIGESTRIIATGDLRQSDLNKNSRDKCGMDKFIRVIQRINGFSLINFMRDDIVRSDFVKNWIIANEDEESSNLPTDRILR